MKKWMIFFIGNVGIWLDGRLKNKLLERTKFSYKKLDSSDLPF
jgi:transposase